MLRLPPEGLPTYRPDESPNSFTPLLNLTIGDARVVACLEVFPEGGEAIPPHRHQATEVFVVLAGEGEARIGAGLWQEIERGTALAVPPETTHTPSGIPAIANSSDPIVVPPSSSPVRRTRCPPPHDPVSVAAPHDVALAAAESQLRTRHLPPCSRPLIGVFTPPMTYCLA